MKIHRQLFLGLPLLAALLPFAGCQSAAPSTAVTAVAPARIADHVVRTRVAGLDVIVCKTGVTDVITFHGSLPAGDRFAPPGNVAIATLVGEMLDKGTTRQDKFAIADQLDGVGASISFETGSSTLVFSGKCLKRDMPLVIGLLAEQLRAPAFAPEELTKLKQQLAGYFQRQMESTDYRASLAFSEALYPPGHPNYTPPTETMLAGIKAATVDDLKKFHAQYYGPAGVTLVVVGDVDVAALQAEAGKAFAGWTGGAKLDPAAKAPPAGAAKTLPVFMPEKTSVTVLWGENTGLKYTDPDTLALRVGTAILGSGFTGRLMATVRNTEGLTYGIGASVADDMFTDGDWRISATFAPGLLEKGLASTKRELTNWFEKGVTADELARRKTNLAGSFKVGLATTDGLASALLAAVNRGLDITWLDQYPEKIGALTLEQVNTAIKQHLNPGNFVLIEAGTMPGGDTKK
jgi:zinc protease